MTLTLVDRETRANLESKNFLLANAVAREIGESLREPQSVLRQLAAILVLYFSDEEDSTSLLLDSAVRNSDYFDSILLLDHRGRVLHVGLPENLRKLRRNYLGLDLAEMPFFARALRGNDVYWSDLFISPVSGEQELLLVFPFSDLVLAGSLNREFLRRLQDVGSNRSGLGLALVDRTGRLIMQSGKDAADQGKTLRHLLPVREGLAGNTGTWTFDWHGRETLGSLARVPGAGWMVLINQDLAGAYAAARHLQVSVAVGLCFAVLLALLVAITFSRRLVRPLQDLSAQIGDIAAGNYQVGLATQPYAEIEELAASVRGMAAEICLREEDLRQSREHYLRLFNSGRDAILVTSLDEKGLPDRLFEANEIACLSLGLDRETLLEARFRDICPDLFEPADKAVELFSRGLKDGHLLFEADIRTALGKQLPHEFNISFYRQEGEPVAFIVARDITDRRMAETALRQSEQQHRLLSRQFQALFDAIPDGLLVFNRELKVSWANRASGDLYGRPPEEILGCSTEDLHGFLGVDIRHCVVSDAMRGGQPERIEMDLPDGRILETRAIPIFDDRKRVDRVIKFIRDVTEQVRSHRDSIRTGQLAAIGELAAGVAHEINNPINGIINYAQIMVNHARAGGDSTELPERIIKEGNRIAGIVSSLLSFSRNRQEAIRAVYLHEVVNDALTLMKAQLRKDGIRVDIALDDDLPPVAGRYQQLEQVLINLLSNARHALNEKYPEYSEDKCLRISAEVAGDGRVRLIVHDRGPGIPEHLLERILDPFFTTKPAGVGTGLGLSITHDIVRDHDGSIDIDSVPGEYTRVIVTLPVYVEMAGEAAASVL
ncbi:ATP-binding protein [Geothermobacter ehrlichii]|uniref:ATP-binding protein n=1 Tax=Geothermobacter ehrlichii TaxID=213224 RepID=UPI001652F4A3|nr:ATP-binding protein [Geothermobacter ehrlichii]